MPEPPSLIVCPVCASASAKNSATCWLCNADLANAPPLIVAELAEDIRFNSTSQQTFSYLKVACILLVIFVGVGIYPTSRGMLLGYLIFVGPAILATFVRAASARQKGTVATAPELILTFIGSLVAVVGIAVLIVVSLVVALFVLCMSQLPRP